MAGCITESQIPSLSLSKRPIPHPPSYCPSYVVPFCDKGEGWNSSVFVCTHNLGYIYIHPHVMFTCTHIQACRESCTHTRKQIHTHTHIHLRLPKNVHNSKIARNSQSLLSLNPWSVLWHGVRWVRMGNLTPCSSLFVKPRGIPRECMRSERRLFSYHYNW